MKKEGYIKLSQTKEGNKLAVVTDLQNVDVADVVMFFMRAFKQSELVHSACFIAVDVFREYIASLEIGVEGLFNGSEVDEENDDEE